MLIHGSPSTLWKVLEDQEEGRGGEGPKVNRSSKDKTNSKVLDVSGRGTSFLVFQFPLLENGGTVGISRRYWNLKCFISFRSVGRLFPEFCKFFDEYLSNNLNLALGILILRAVEKEIGIKNNNYVNVSKLPINIRLTEVAINRTTYDIIIT